MLNTLVVCTYDTVSGRIDCYIFLSRHFLEQTRTSLGCDTQACLRFWSGLKSSGLGRILFREHGLLRGSTPEQLARTIPLVIHEDAGPFSKSQSVSVLNYSSITGRGAEFDIKFVVSTFIKVSGEGRRPLSDDPGWAAILDSFLLLANGVFPVGPYAPDSDAHRLAGQPIVELFGIM